MSVYPSFRRYLASRWDRRRAVAVALLVASFVFVNTQHGWRDPLFVALVALVVVAAVVVIGAAVLATYFARAVLSAEGQTIRLVGLIRTQHFPVEEVKQLNRTVAVASWRTRLRYFIALDSQSTILFTLFGGLWDPESVEEFALANGIRVTGDWTQIVPRESLKVGSRLARDFSRPAH
jgi:hypothetical protein